MQRPMTRRNCFFLFYCYCSFMLVFCFHSMTFYSRFMSIVLLNIVPSFLFKSTVKTFLSLFPWTYSLSSPFVTQFASAFFSEFLLRKLKKNLEDMFETWTLLELERERMENMMTQGRKKLMMILMVLFCSSLWSWSLFLQSWWWWFLSRHFCSMISQWFLFSLLSSWSFFLQVH